MILATTKVENVERFLEVFASKGAVKRSRSAATRKIPGQCESTHCLIANRQASDRDAANAQTSTIDESDG